MATLRILHLSDLHFGVMAEPDGRPERSAHYFTQRDNGGLPDPAQLARLLRSEIEEAPPSIIVASGDVGWSGSKDDYSHATDFFRQLRQAVPQAKLVIAPGNHDVNRDTGDDERRQDAFIGMLEEIHGNDFDTDYKVYRTANPPSRALLVAATVIPNVDDPGGPPSGVVVAFNSAGSLQKDSTPILIEPYALEQIDGHLKGLGLPENALRVCVLHHHLFPFAEPSRHPNSDTRRASELGADPDLLANSAKIQGWLAQRSFHLVLHGHKHTSHGREDLLWRRNDRSGRRLLVIGAGSAGVENGHRAQMEPLSFNQITATRLSSRRWQVHVDVREVRVDVAVPEIAPLYEFRSIVGDRAHDQDLPIFQAEQMDDCHRAITLATKDGALFHGFLSVVEDHRYIHPSTARYGDRPAEVYEIRNCFRQLHPEYDENDNWDNEESYDDRLHKAQLRYRFEHGSRLFRSPDRRTRSDPSDIRQTSPMLWVIEELKRNPTTSKAYVGLYRPEIDLLSAGSEPLPGLMSLQFIKRAAVLDVTVTFRKIELSFWWCVNMMEVGELLRWVAKRVGIPPGRITFFAGLAEWKHNPEAAIEAKLDGMSVSTMMKLVLDQDWGEIIRLLDEKVTRTHDNNLDSTGLAQLAEVIVGAASRETTSRSALESLRDRIRDATRAIDAARAHADPRQIRTATTALAAATEILRSLGQQ